MGAFFSKVWCNILILMTGRSNKSKYLLCGSDQSKSEENLTESTKIEELMGQLDSLSSNVGINMVEADFKPLFPRKNGKKHLDCFLHYYDPEKRDNLKVLCSLEPFQWRKINCERGDQRGHYLAHFCLPKSFNKPFQFKFIVNNEYVLAPTAETNNYNVILTEDGFTNNAVDPSRFQTFDPKSLEK
uniref:Uncharacterized protein n=1 Tax=Panagrolaimus sp. JU765 TaxID=591449 RepID=A0AC34QFI9_9BILA